CWVAMAVLFLALLVTATAFAAQAFQPRPCFRCPWDWIGYRGKCWFFGEAEGNWTWGRDNCTVLGASLATLDSLEDLNFAMRFTGISENWIGLSRQNEEKPWEWVNGSRFSHLFRVHGDGLCASLGARGVDSSHCGAKNHWVCTKTEVR
ncbi:C-type lectin domain family 2 member E, partial [Mesitornis unicolor]